MHKLLSSDNKITDRIIAAEIRSAALLLIKQQTDRRKLWQSSTLFTRIECIEMEPVPLALCCSFQSDCYIRKSIHKLPDIAEGIFGPLIQGVYNITTSQSFIYTTANRYANILKLNLKNIPTFYWNINNYLYVTDPHIELVSMAGYFEESIPEYLNGCGKQNKNPCDNPLDQPFRLPGFLENTLKDIVYEKLLKTYFRHVPDITHDLRDDSH